MKRINIITGHYGSGKTNLSVNLAVNAAKEGKKVTFLTGESKNKNAIDLNEGNLSSDLEEEINKVIANCKF